MYNSLKIKIHVYFLSEHFEFRHFRPHYLDVDTIFGDLRRECLHQRVVRNTIFWKALPSVVSGYGKRSINLNKVVFMFQLQLFFAPLLRMGPRCSSAETQVCHRSYIIAAILKYTCSLKIYGKFTRRMSVCPSTLSIKGWNILWN
jgi:hypothetical protein